MNDNLKNKVIYIKIVRNMAIILPVILCIIIFCYFLFLPSIRSDAINLEFKIINLGLSIFAILAAVWIGLNIYNVLDKKDVIELKNSLKEDILIIKEELECFVKIESSRTIAQNMKNSYEKISIYNDIVNKYGKYYSAYMYRAMYYQEVNKYLDAINDFNVALKLSNNNNLDIIYNRGRCYYMIGKYKQAIDDFNVCINNNVYRVGSYNNRALAYKGLKRFDEAVKDLTLLINEEDENLYYFYYARGGCYFDIKSYESAVKDLKCAFDLCKDFSELYFKSLISAYVCNEDFGQVVKLIDANISKIRNKDYFLNIKDKANNYIEVDISSSESTNRKEKESNETIGDKKDEIN